ncbi:ribonuclease P protein component [Corynebacterium uropygiale]|uniref:Ribonuclease P protein component n=1 Tax=Corynebacterium uropygiale TaxID=1775911 RepID=A0A9X1U8A5_9CORY|nr:ribonuclease P protein component [Corynebacterium uropygiale]
MLPRANKLTSPAQFSRTIKGGQRAGARRVVVHYLDHAGEDVAQMGGPRFGLIVSKAVGNAVVRHRTSRRLRHICLSLLPEVPPTADVVIRALPRAGDSTSAELAQDITKALAHARRKQSRAFEKDNHVPSAAAQPRRNRG